MNHREIAYALLRVTLAVIFLFAGIGKFKVGVGSVAGGMLQQFSGKLPALLVQPFSYSLPFAETILGTLILLGLFTTLALTLSGLLLVALTFGTVVLGDSSTAAHNAQYALVNFVLLWLVEFNQYSIDRLRRGTGLRAPKLFVAVLCVASSLAASAGLDSAASTRSVLKGPAATTRFKLDPAQSRFMVRAFAGGLLWFRGHDHFIAVRDFSGEVQITPDSLTPAALHLTAKADSLAETRAVFTEQQKQIINKELREIVLEPSKYPDITFRSTDVTGKPAGSNRYDVKIGGDLTLHGVTNHIVIPAQVTLSGNVLRAGGEFTIDRNDFKVKATSAFHGLVRVRDKLKFTFDIIGHRI